MFSNVFDQQETFNPREIAQKLLALTEKRADAETKEKLGVNQSFIDGYIAGVTTQVDRIEQIGARILNRMLLVDLKALVITARNIVNNVRRDPNDVHEEISLDTALKEVADALDWYSTAVSYPSIRRHQTARLATIEKEIHEVRLPWIKALYERMLANDEASPVDRLALSSVYFKSPSL